MVSVYYRLPDQGEPPNKAFLPQLQEALYWRRLISCWGTPTTLTFAREAAQWAIGNPGDSWDEWRITSQDWWHTALTEGMRHWTWWSPSPAWPTQWPSMMEWLYQWNGYGHYFSGLLQSLHLHVGEFWLVDCLVGKELAGQLHPVVPMDNNNIPQEDGYCGIAWILLF